MNQNNNTFLSEERQPAREYKDRLFCKIFEDKKDLLGLYTAVNETDYTNPDSLEVNALTM